jgi:glutathione S-transferase
MTTQPLELWAHWGAPNPWKVCMIFEILKLPYTLHFLEFSEVKNDSHIALNPNGRLPTLKDLNTGIVLWEVRIIFIRYILLSWWTWIDLSAVRCNYPLPH